MGPDFFFCDTRRRSSTVPPCKEAKIPCTTSSMPCRQCKCVRARKSHSVLLLGILYHLAHARFSDRNGLVVAPQDARVGNARNAESATAFTVPRCTSIDRTLQQSVAKFGSTPVHT